ncbi:MAG TPA: segregation/condensation protein A [Actinomycetes bacterium]|nr:segregation/condensation protein A [Actinomycetes bacterium]
MAVLDYRAAVDPSADASEDAAVASSGSGDFRVDLGDLFEGPFDLLLGLIAKHKLDVTEVALSKVTDEFIAHIKGKGPEWDLGQATEFLVVAATLLDLKAARLLPSGEVDDEEDLALLEARDLLFARLLQYRAYKQVAAVFAGRMAVEAGRYARAVSLEPQLATLLPEVLIGLGPTEFAALAARAMTPRPVPMVSMDHLHAPAVSVKEQAGILVIALRRSRTSTFRQLVADCEGTLVVVARFLALLELYREGAVTFDQVDPLGELHIRWTGTDDGEVDVEDEFDDVPPPEGAADPPPDDAVPLEVAEADQPDDVRPQQPQESATDD